MKKLNYLFLADPDYLDFDDEYIPEFSLEEILKKIQKKHPKANLQNVIVKILGFGDEWKDPCSPIAIDIMLKK